MPPGPIDLVLEHGASLEEVHVALLCVLPSEFRSGEVAQKTKIAGAASVDSDDRSDSEDAPLMAVLVKFTSDGPALVGRRVASSRKML